MDMHYIFNLYRTKNMISVEVCTRNSLKGKIHSMSVLIFVTQKEIAFENWAQKFTEIQLYEGGGRLNNLLSGGDTSTR